MNGRCGSAWKHQPIIDWAVQGLSGRAGFAPHQNSGEFTYALGTLSAAGACLSIESPAKLNLALSVGAPGADGMHPIASWMVAITLCDSLHVTRLADDRLSRYAILWHKEARRRSDIDWPIAKDLAVRAHLAVQQQLGRVLPVQLKLEKRIPVGGGLGGGSSDAAGMLHALNELFDLGLTTPDLAETGSMLGSDVPFLVHVLGRKGSGAMVEGLGERIAMAPLGSPLHAVIVLPEIRCDTAEVYRAFDDLGRGGLQGDRVRGLIGRGDSMAARELFNDLSEPAFAVGPALREHLRDLSRLAKRDAHITGSGSTLFVVCDDAMHAEALATAVEAQLRLPAIPVSDFAGRRA